MHGSLQRSCSLGPLQQAPGRSQTRQALRVRCSVAQKNENVEPAVSPAALQRRGLLAAALALALAPRPADALSLKPADQYKVLLDRTFLAATLSAFCSVPSTEDMLITKAGVPQALLQAFKAASCAECILTRFATVSSMLSWTQYTKRPSSWYMAHGLVLVYPLCR